MKVGIYTIHTCNNYGAMLQAFATQKALDKIGINSEIVNIYTKTEELNNKYIYPFNSIKNVIKTVYDGLNPKIKLKSKRFADFHNHMKLSKRYYSLDEIYHKPPIYDIHLVGSDQVWNLENGLRGHGFYFLDFLPSHENIMSYASSFGSDVINVEDRQALKLLLEKFRYISVREQSGVDLIKKYTGLNASLVMDPTFLLNQKDWEKLAGDSPLINDDYIVAYGFANRRETNQLIDVVKRKYNMPVVGLSVSIHHPFNYDSFYQEAGPIEFLNLIKNAKFVITASYHGAAFAIHLKKDFFVSKHPTRNSRIETMLALTGLEVRMIDLSDPASYKNKETTINYSSFVLSKITEMSEYSFNWLQNCIHGF